MRPPILFPFGKLAPFAAAGDSPENTATLKVQDVVIELGAPTARIPITISSEHPGQLISGIYATVAIGVLDMQLPILDLETVFQESLWNAHPMPIQQVFQFDKGTVALNQLTWFEPEDKLAIPCDGTVAILTVDTSGVEVPSEYHIATDHMGHTSATVLKQEWTYYPIRLTHDTGLLRIVPKRG